MCASYVCILVHDIVALYRTFLFSTFFNHKGGRYRAVAHLPTSIIGWVIGHKGCNARMLKQQTGTELWVDVPGQV